MAGGCDNKYIFTQLRDWLQNKRQNNVIQTVYIRSYSYSIRIQFLLFPTNKHLLLQPIFFLTLRKLMSVVSLTTKLK